MEVTTEAFDDIDDDQRSIGKGLINFIRSGYLSLTFFLTNSMEQSAVWCAICSDLVF